MSYRYHITDLEEECLESALFFARTPTGSALGQFLALADAVEAERIATADRPGTPAPSEELAQMWRAPMTRDQERGFGRYNFVTATPPASDEEIVQFNRRQEEDDAASIDRIAARMKNPPDYGAEVASKGEVLKMWTDPISSNIAQFVDPAKYHKAWIDYHIGQIILLATQPHAPAASYEDILDANARETLAPLCPLQQAAPIPPISGPGLDDFGSVDRPSAAP